MTLVTKLIAYALAIVVTLSLGAFSGYRYADGRCAIARDADRQAVEAHMANALELASKNAEAANSKASTAAKKLAALESAQVKERIVYEKAPPAPDCRLPDDTFRLLVNQIHRANGDYANGSR